MRPNDNPTPAFCPWRKCHAGEFVAARSPSGEGCPWPVSANRDRSLDPALRLCLERRARRRGDEPRRDPRPPPPWGKGWYALLRRPLSPSGPSSSCARPSGPHASPTGPGSVPRKTLLRRDRRTPRAARARASVRRLEANAGRPSSRLAQNRGSGRRTLPTGEGLLVGRSPRIHGSGARRPRADPSRSALPSIRRRCAPRPQEHRPGGGRAIELQLRPSRFRRADNELRTVRCVGEALFTTRASTT